MYFFTISFFFGNESNVLLLVAVVGYLLYIVIMLLCQSSFFHVLVRQTHMPLTHQLISPFSPFSTYQNAGMPLLTNLHGRTCNFIFYLKKERKKRISSVHAF
jgi:hypothetical protein